MAPGAEPVPSTRGAGVESTVHHLSVAQSRLGHQVTVIDIVDEERPPVPYRVAEVPLRFPVDRRNPLVHALRQLRFQRAAARKLAELLAEEPYDVVHFHGQFAAAGGLAVARRYGALAVFSSHNPTWGSRRLCRSRLQRVKYLMEMLSLRRADGVITDSAAVAHNLSAYLGVPARKLQAVPIGVDEAYLARVPVPAAFRRRHAPGGAPLVLSVARLAPYKNQAGLVQAMRLVADLLPEARLLLVGQASDAAYATRVREMARDLGLAGRCRLLGAVPPEDLRRLYSLCDVFVMPSLWESQGLSVLEAMAAGRPVVASDIGPVRENVPPGAGILAPPGDHAALAEAIVTLLRDPDRRRAMGREGRRFVFRERRWERMAELTMDAYARFAGRPVRLRRTGGPGAALSRKGLGEAREGGSP
ncbi:MAG: glycosyltransferase family 4 protein [Dehalococcoidia bacterium]|nr:glycosyltransferase family 4 protein [Dehalococcoidia bacterium]